MHTRRLRWRTASIAAAVLTSAWAPALLGQRIDAPVSDAPSARAPREAWVLVPQTVAIRRGRLTAPVRITGVRASIDISAQAATTTLDVDLRNDSAGRQEAELLVPVPEDAILRGFDFQGGGSETSARLMPRAEARKLYDSIVARAKDPALLEFVGTALVRSSVFPVEPGGTQKIRIVYETLLPKEGDRIDYVLPRTESAGYAVPWKISARIESTHPVSTVYSPSHSLETTRIGDRKLSLRISDSAEREPGPFRLSFLTGPTASDGKASLSTSVFAYPDPRLGGGYFLLLAGLPAVEVSDAEKIRREVTLVIDRSGSMNGEKIDQAREAALQVIAGLEEGESFNIIPYCSTVEMFSPAPVVKSKETEARARQYLKAMRSFSGTNIHDALVEALRQKPTEGTLPIVLFLTDGLPTVGQTSEVAIREVAKNGNPHQRRIFTFGVGLDVNTPLLDKIATETRAVATFVLPKEDVEVKVGSVFSRLAGPVLADPKLQLLGPDGVVVTSRVSDLQPNRLPDVFEGDQIVVLGRYLGEEPLRFRLDGNFRGLQRSFQFTHGVEKATTRNSFVPRLWASRQIAGLIDAIRELGATDKPTFGPGKKDDPRLKELIDEVVRLSTEFGILTEYTAFFAEEGVDLTSRRSVRLLCEDNFRGRALNVRSGIESLNQELNGSQLRRQKTLNFRNNYWDTSLEQRQTLGVQHVNDLAFYSRAGCWIDSRIVATEKPSEADEVLYEGTPAYAMLLTRLAHQGRQGSVALRGDVLLEVEGRSVLLRRSAAPAKNAATVERTEAGE